MPPPPNAYQPGTKLTVGSHSVAIIKYLSAGGFAHVYTCTIDPPFQGSSAACLKRVVVPNKWQLNLLRQEVDAMKRLRGNGNIVSYIDSHASRLNNTDSKEQQYEVFLLMEYCSRHGLIDFMNTRLTHKLTEPEILVIMRDITVGVTMCHHLEPPLIHRDIKIENVLIDKNGTYKLCDFGSAVGYHAVPQTSQELQQLHDDLMQHTTPQYRSPEMIDLSKGFAIDDKLDIWALGCFLYKLCYYTTPFELSSHTSLRDMEVLILNCNVTLKIPHDMPGLTFSPRLKNIIKCCLRPDPRRRPSGDQLLGEICSMMGERVPNVIPHTVKVKADLRQDLKKPERPERESRQEAKTPPLPARKDPFASIDKSKLLQKKIKPDAKPESRNRINTSYIPSYVTTPNSRPVSAYVDDKSLKNFIQKQLNESSEDISLRPDDNGTLDFLRSREEGLNQRQNTGGSFKNFKNGLRKISTGGSSISSAQNTGNSAFNGMNKRSSIASLKQLLTGGSRRASPEELEAEEKPKKLSIQRRMAMLMNNKEPEMKKTAQGYGRFTDVDDDLDLINRNTVSSNVTPEPTAKVAKPPKVPASLSSKKPPPKPKKPVYLKSPDTRRLSNGSELSLPDLDDMEKQFSKRYPSYV